MNKKEIIRNVALIIVFCAVGFILFTENVRTVQIIGLFACGAVAGVSLSRIIITIKIKKRTQNNIINTFFLLCEGLFTSQMKAEGEEHLR